MGFTSFVACESAARASIMVVVGVRAGSMEETCLANAMVSALRHGLLKGGEQRRASHGFKEASHAQQQFPWGLYEPNEMRG